MHLEILPLSDHVRTLYENHGHFHQGDSGLDLFVPVEQTIQPGETGFVPLGIKTAAYRFEAGEDDEQDITHEAVHTEPWKLHTRTHLPCSWLVFPRSSISKTPLRLANSIGLIDAGYRGEIIACLDNIKKEPYTVRTGDRLLQAVSFSGEPILLKIVKELDATTRGEGGFGSTTTKEKGHKEKDSDSPVLEPSALKKPKLTTSSSSSSSTNVYSK